MQPNIFTNSIWKPAIRSHLRDIHDIQQKDFHLHLARLLLLLGSDIAAACCMPPSFCKYAAFFSAFSQKFTFLLASLPMFFFFFLNHVIIYVHLTMPRHIYTLTRIRMQQQCNNIHACHHIHMIMLQIELMQQQTHHYNHH